MRHRAHKVVTWFESIQEHIVAFAISLFVIAWIGSVLIYRNQLFGDITGANVSATNPVYASPLVYTVKDWELLISATKQFTDAKSVRNLRHNVHQINSQSADYRLGREYPSKPYRAPIWRKDARAALDPSSG